MLSSRLLFPLLSVIVASETRSLWSTLPADASDVIRTAYPIGNGKVALLPFGQAGVETLTINRDSLWTGGPFENRSYDGNLHGQRYQYLPDIRQWIWQNGTGNASKLMGDNNNYGSYAVLGNLTVHLHGIRDVSKYKRSLDLTNGVHSTSYQANGATYTIETYCSYVDDVCVYDISSSKALPDIDVSLANILSNSSLVEASCSVSQVQLRGMTNADIGMIYQATVRLLGRNVQGSCSGGALTMPSNGDKQATFVLAAGTNYDQSKGNAASDYSFRGADPRSYVQSAVIRAVLLSAGQLRHAHTADYGLLADAFQLSLPDIARSANLETSTLVERYGSNPAGDPYLEALTFDFARHLLISSARDGSLPPNLQGKWATGISNAWGADYHSDINIQMNHWHADQTGLGTLQKPLFEYIRLNWAPRGAQAARLLYNAPGWVVHNEMNIFGSSGMKTGYDIWVNYPISAAWLMQHVWDYFDYSQDLVWLRNTGYPLLQAVARFWLSQLQKDDYSKDGTLVVNPCTSAEHGPTTFGCAHYQQLIHQVFETTLQASTVVADDDIEFITSLRTSLSYLDKGLHIGSWGQIQEWKLNLDVKNDTHRHLSHLVGWHPGYSISSYLNGYTNRTIQSSIATSLYSRGSGIADDNAGWEKIWRAAAWARLNNSNQAYEELHLAIRENWAPNLLSMYSGKNGPFQIDANFGFAGAVLSMLVVDLPESYGNNGSRTVVLGPAIPKTWGNGSVKGLRVRGGGLVNFSWDENGTVDTAVMSGSRQDIRLVNVKGVDLTISGVEYEQ